MYNAILSFFNRDGNTIVICNIMQLNKKISRKIIYFMKYTGTQVICTTKDIIIQICRLLYTLLLNLGSLVCCNLAIM